MKYTTWFDSLSLREQCGFLTGADQWRTAGSERLGIPHVRMSDGPSGLRRPERGHSGKTAEAVCYPSASAMASTWDRDAMRVMGTALGQECRAEQIGLLLGPGVNLKRSPRCGRNFEYLSEDPLTAGELAAAYIDGVQSQGVGTALKHFACNSTETMRMKADSVVDDRALHELYLKPFEIAVKKSQPWAVMAAYNKLNGVYCTESSWLLEETLRKEWGFQGLVVSDWGAVNSRPKALAAGTDLEMPGTGNEGAQELSRGMREGTVTEENIRTSVGRVFDLVAKVEPNRRGTFPSLNLNADHETAAALAEGCPVLLKNRRSLLPVQREEKIAVIGARAAEPLIQGGGSAHVRAHRVSSPYECLRAVCRNLSYCDGYDLEHPDYVDRRKMEEAVSNAEKADKVLVFVSCAEADVTEGMDRRSLKLPAAMDALVEAVSGVSMNVAVILMTGGVAELPWADRVNAILWSGLRGEGAGEALSRILLGEVSPSGRLSETWPMRLEDVPCADCLQPDENGSVLYKESIFMGYRYYQRAGVPVRYPFGYGLSYCQFAYSNLQISEADEQGNYTVAFQVTNEGGIPAAEVPQLYVGYSRLDESYLYRPVRELRGFTKLFLDAHETRNVSFTLDPAAFESYSTENEVWQAEPGEYTIEVGASSEDIRLSGSVRIENPGFGELDYRARTPAYFNCALGQADEREFVFLLRYDPAVFLDDSGRITADSTIADCANTSAGRWLDRAVQKLASHIGGPLSEEVWYESLRNMPLNRFVRMTRGRFSAPMLDALVMYLDGGDAADAAKLALAGLPEALLNLLLPLGQKAAPKIPDRLVPAGLKKLGKKKKKA